MDVVARAVIVALALVAAAAAPAHAQSAITGAIAGRVVDGAGEPLAGVRVSVAGSPHGRDPRARATATGGDGTYKLTGLAPGWYVIAFDGRPRASTLRAGIRVHAGAVTTVIETLDGRARVVGVEPAPPLDVSSAELRGTADRAFLTRVPLPDRDALGAAGVWPGVQGDRAGLAVAGSSGLENRFYLDGLDVTGVRIGDAPALLLGELVEEVRLVTGGAGADQRGAPGGLVHVVTKRGSNRFAGSVFGTLAPRALAAARTRIARPPALVAVEVDRALTADFGADASGPLVRDRLWFYVGLAPQLVRDDHTRVTRRYTDCRRVLAGGRLSGCDPRPPGAGGHADGEPDVDPATGELVLDELDRTTRRATRTAYTALARLDLALPPAHQAQLVALATPSRRRTPELHGEPGAGVREDALRLDTAARWTTTLDGGATELEAFAGWHHARRATGALDPRLDAVPRQLVGGLDTAAIGALGLESARTIAGCTDGGAADPYPFLTNCQGGVRYALGGPGEREREREDRLGARVSAARRVEGAGAHELKAGLDLDVGHLAVARSYSGGALVSAGSSLADVLRWVELAAPGDDDPRFDRTCTTPGRDGAVTSFRCAYVPGVEARARAVYGGAYLRDAWRPHPSLTLDAGLRYERQQLRAADRDALDLRGDLAPRLAATWDPSRIGEAKLFAAWGRYLQPVPLSLVARPHEAGAFLRQTFHAGAPDRPCGPPDPRTGLPGGLGCLTPTGAPWTESVYGPTPMRRDADLRAPRLDELLAGGELVLGGDTRLGLALRRRALARVLEDVALDGGDGYLLAHPAGATRAYRAIELVAARRLTRGLFVQASYTYARTTGSYAGPLAAETGQLDPHRTSQFDFPELATNRSGPLPTDRPHLLKLDGHYTHALGRDHAITLGTRARALSGAPVSVLAAHAGYGADEVFLLPRGRFARAPFVHVVDVHAGYARRLPRGVVLELFADVFDALDGQQVSAIDQTYAPSIARTAGGTPFQAAAPIAGGAYEDLIWAKRIDGAGAETSAALARNPNFGKPLARYAPRTVRLGARITF